MHFLPLTLLFCTLIGFSSAPIVEYPTSPPVKNAEATAETNILLQSKDGGQTWQDISQSLPSTVQPEDFFAGESGVYMRVENVLYSSKSNLKTFVWEKENVLDQQNASVAFNRSGVMAYNYDGKIYQKSSAGTWSSIYTNFKKQTMHNIFESSDGAVFVGSDNGLYKSADKGKSWKLVQNEGWVRDIVESDGVLIGVGQNGIMRSTDNGEHWEWVISEGGVGIAVERIHGGFAAISYSNSTKSRRVRISMDRGKTWKAIDEGLRPSLSISSIKQIGYNLVCAHPDGIFLSTDMGKTWKRVHSGVHTNVSATFNFWNNNSAAENNKVYKLYVSGNVVYAVMRDFGC